MAGNSYNASQLVGCLTSYTMYLGCIFLGDGMRMIRDLNVPASVLPGSVRCIALCSPSACILALPVKALARPDHILLIWCKYYYLCTIFDGKWNINRKIGSNSELFSRKHYSSCGEALSCIRIENWIWIDRIGLMGLSIYSFTSWIMIGSMRYNSNRHI